MADLVIGNDLLFLRAEHGIFALRPRDDRLYALLQIRLFDRTAPHTHSAQRGFVDDIRQIRAGRARGRAGDRGEVDMPAHDDVLGMYLEDGNAPLQVGQLHRDTPVKTARTQQRRVKRLRPVGRREDDNALGAVKAVHLGQQLIERLLTFIVASKPAAVALFADGIDLVDEHNAGRLLACLLEQVAYLGRAHTDKHFHKFRAGNGEERHMRLAGDRLGKQRLAGARRADKQRALGQLCADARILARVVQEIHDLSQSFLGFVLTGHIRKGLAGLGLCVYFRARFSKAHGIAAHALHHLFAHPLADRNDNNDRDCVADQNTEQRRGLRRDLGGELDVRVIQTVIQIRVRENAGLVNGRFPVLICCLEYDLAFGLVVCYGLYPSLVQHGSELIIAHLGHPALHQRREKQPVEQHQHRQCDGIVKDQRSFWGFG